jgi:tetratricopeptide (TPR) repeat protein
MRAHVLEYFLKGIFLGLAIYGSLQAGRLETPTYLTFLLLNGVAWAGLFVAFIAGVISQRAQLKVGLKNPAAFILFLILENSSKIFDGILLGTALGVFVAVPSDSKLLISCVGLGGALGLSFFSIRKVKVPNIRLGIIFAVAAGLCAAIAYFLGVTPWNENPLILPHPQLFSLQLIAFLPLFYILTFCGIAEESEVEIGAFSSLLGIALGILTMEHVPLRTLGFLAPIVLFFVYTMRILPALRILKHVFRGMSFAKLGQQKNALMAFKRALQLDPQNNLARNNYWKLHADLDPIKLETDPETMALVDCDLCLDRVESLLVSGKPSDDKVAEALRLLSLVEKLKPSLNDGTRYWRAVLALHDKNFVGAAAILIKNLNNYHVSEEQLAGKYLYPSWSLALAGHPEMKSRVGFPLLTDAAIKMNAIAAVERHIAQEKDDQAAWGIKRFLYTDMTSKIFFQNPPRSIADFDFMFVKDLGLALLEQQKELARGAEYLDIAVAGLPQHAPFLMVQVGKAFAQQGQEAEAESYFEKAVAMGRKSGHKNLQDQDRLAYFSALKFLADSYLHRKDTDKAIEYYHLFAQFERSGVETLRTLATLHEEKGEALAALRAVEQALIYQPDEKDLIARKDRYLYSITVEELTANKELLAKGFDVDYCMKRAKGILESKLDGPDWIDVARHLSNLAMVFAPESIQARTLYAKALLRHGDRTEAKEILEQVRDPKPGSFSSSDDEDSWYGSCQVLGDIYMELDEFEKAVACFQDFKKSPKSGARTWLKLGIALEKLNDTKKAIACYEQATAYEGNPFAREAQEALYRLK